MCLGVQVRNDEQFKAQKSGNTQYLYTALSVSCRLRKCREMMHSEVYILNMNNRDGDDCTEAFDFSFCIATALDEESKEYQNSSWD